MTCGVITVASHVPSQELAAVSVAEGLSVPADFVQDKLGTDRLPRIDGNVQTSDLAVSAVEAMVGHDRYDPAEVRVLVVVTQNPDGRGLPHTAANLKDKELY